LGEKSNKSIVLVYFYLIIDRKNYYVILLKIKMENKNIKKNPINSDIKSVQWYLIDAKDQILGRLSSFLATRLMGKHKVSYSDNKCLKDKIVVINAKKVILTGRKINKKHYWHTGYPGGIKNKTYKEILNSKNSTLVLKNSVRRMLKKGSLSREQLKNLYIYSDDKHPHNANNPSILNL
jgi:large subunit ribosomal protein L13